MHDRHSFPELSRIGLLVALLWLTACGGWPRYAAAPMPEIETSSGHPEGDVPQRAAEATPATSAVADSSVDKSWEIIEATAPDLAGAGSTAVPPGSVTLDFEDSDIRDVVAVILGDTLKQNYIVEDGVSGRVSMRTQRGLQERDLLPVLESLLAMNNAGMLREPSGFVRIVPRDRIRGSVLPVTPETAMLPAGYQTRIVPLRFIGALEVQKILQPFLSDQLVLHLDERRNVVMLAGSSSDIDKLRAMIDLFDVDAFAGMSVGLFPLKFARPDVIIPEIEAILGRQNEEGKASNDGMLRLIAIDRLSSILAVTSQPVYLERVKQWVVKLDQAEDSDARRLFVYRVENGKASDLAAVLNQIFVVSTAPGQYPPMATVAPGMAPIMLQAPGTVADTAPGASSLDEGLGASAGSINGSGVRIIADDGNNALVILATSREYRMVSDALSRLDVTPLQVLIEASIVEVSLTDDLRYGVEWFFKNDASIRGSGEGRGLLDLGGAGIGPIVPGFSYALVDGADRVRAALNLLASRSDVKVLSSPSLMVLGNQTATINVGDEVPVPTRQSVSNIDPDAPTVNEIQYRDTGVILEVTPRVNTGGLVTMEVAQEVSDVGPTTTSGIDAPTFQQRKIKSTIAIQSGNTIVLGGLIRDRASTGKSGVPLVSDIPLLGELFSATSKEGRRTELMVLITPRAVSNVARASEVTNEYRNKLRALPVDGRFVAPTMP